MTDEFHDTYTRSHKDRRVSNIDRRVSDIERRHYSDDEHQQMDKLFELVRDLTENRYNKSISNHTHNPNPNPNTFTLTQVLAGMFAIMGIIGSVLATWVNFNNQITTMKVSTDLLFDQIQKAYIKFDQEKKEYHNKSEGSFDKLKVDIIKLSDRIESVDSSVNQLYSRNINGKSK